MKHQAPTSKLQRNTKRQAPRRAGSLFELWSLKFLWSLVLGIWSFIL